MNYIDLFNLPPQSSNKEIEVQTDWVTRPRSHISEGWGPDLNLGSLVPEFMLLATKLFIEIKSQSAVVKQMQVIWAWGLSLEEVLTNFPLLGSSGTVLTR